MLSTMRNNLKTLSWTLWLVILTFVGFIFVEWGMGTNAMGGDNSNLLMSIDGEAISLQDFKYYQTLYKWNNQQTFNQLKNNGVLSHEAKKLDMIATEEELNSQIFDIFQYDGVFMGMEQYRNFLTRSNININSFEKFLKRYFILPRKYMNFISSAQVLNDESLARSFKQSRDYADIEYIKIAPEWIKDAVSVTDEQRKVYYDKNKKNYFAPEMREGLIVTLDPKQLTEKSMVSDQEIETYYNNNKTQFQKKSKIRVSRIFLNYNKKNKSDMVALAKDIKQNLTVQNFAQKAMEFSQDSKNKLGGDWGYDLDKLIKKERKIARRLEINQISDLIYTGSSISILHVTEKSDAKTKPLEMVKKIIRDKLAPEKMKKEAEGKLLEFAKKLRRESDITKLKSDGFIIRKTGLVKKDNVIPGLDESSTLSNELFKLKAKKVSGIIEVVQDTKQNYGIVKCTAIQKAGIEKMVKVIDRIDKDLVRAEKAKMLKDKTPEITKRLNELKDPKKIKEYLEAEKLVADSFKYRRGNRLLYFPEREGLDKQIFSMTPGIYSEPLVYENNAVIVKLKAKKITTDEEFKNGRTDYYNTQLRMKSGIFMQNYITSKIAAYEKAGKIKMNKELVTNLLKQNTNTK